MEDYNIVKLPTDYTILQMNLNKLYFVDGVAIYYDKEKTHRDVFTVYSNFNAWLNEYTKRHNIPFYEFTRLIKSLVIEVKKELLDSFEPNKSFFIPGDFREKLNAIKEVGRGGDAYSYQTVLKLIWQYLPIENNYSIVREDGSFLMTWFCNNIIINHQGLFKCEKREYGYDNCFPRIIRTSNSIYFWDSKGNYINDFALECSLKILSNCKSDYFSLLSERKDLNFNVDRGQYFEYMDIYDGKSEVEWEQLRPDGLTFYYTESTERGSDYWYHANPYVRDQFGNHLGISDFYKSLEMLCNGKKYLEALINDSIERQICRLK